MILDRLLLGPEGHAAVAKEHASVPLRQFGEIGRELDFAHVRAAPLEEFHPIRHGVLRSRPILVPQHGIEERWLETLGPILGRPGGNVILQGKNGGSELHVFCGLRVEPQRVRDEAADLSILVGDGIPRRFHYVDA